MSGVVDAVLAGAWLGSVLAAWAPAGRRPPARLAAALGVAALLAALGMHLERSAGGRLWSARPATAAGLALVLAGTVLHARARAALGTAWGPSATPGTELVARGPYARIRHPAYAGLVLMAIGTCLAHASLAVAAAMAGLVTGLVVKARMEDRRLAARFGERWRRWAASVPPWCPWSLRSRGRPR